MATVAKVYYNQIVNDDCMNELLIRDLIEMLQEHLDREQDE